MLRVEGPDGVILHDALLIEPDEDDAYVALAPGHRAVGMAAEFGERRVSRVEHEKVDARVARGAVAAAVLPGVAFAAGDLDRGGWLWRASGASVADVELALAAR